MRIKRTRLIKTQVKKIFGIQKSQRLVAQRRLTVKGLTVNESNQEAKDARVQEERVKNTHVKTLASCLREEGNVAPVSLRRIIL